MCCFVSLLGSQSIEAEISEATPDTKLPEELVEPARKAAEAFSRQDWAEARKLYEEIVAKAPGNSLMLSNLGSALFQQGNFKEAVTHLAKAVAANPKLIHARITLGLSHHYSGDTFLAISELARAVHEKPDDFRARSYFAIVLRENGWPDAAESQLLKAVELNPRFADAHYNLAVIYFERNPPALELVRRHYFKSVEMGAPRDQEIENALKNKDD